VPKSLNAGLVIRALAKKAREIQNVVYEIDMEMA